MPESFEKIDSLPPEGKPAEEAGENGVLETPKNLERAFSKELAPELRQETAARIKEIRRLGRSRKEIAGTEIFEDPEAREMYEELSGSIFRRVFERQYFQELEQRLTERVGEIKDKLIAEAQARFESKLGEILEQSPLTPKEQEQYLSEEAVTAMDLENYLLLLKRLSGNFVAHITRQGIREKDFGFTGPYQSFGRGEFHNNFVEVLNEGRILSFFGGLENGGAHLDDYFKQEISIIRSFRPDATDEEVIENIWDSLKQSELGAQGESSAELTSVHFSINEVITDIYGAERDYDIYFYYPAEFIALNYFHQTKGATKPEEELTLRTGLSKQGKFANDVFVWTEQGVPVDAALVCIPADVMVDSETGSQYALDKDKHPVTNPEMTEQFSFITEKSTDVLSAMDELMRWRREHNWPFELPREFMARLGFVSDETFLQFCKNEALGLYEDTESLKNAVAKAYEASGAAFARPANAVSSQEYWEKFFADHPNSRPSKVLFYFKGLPHYKTAERTKEEKSYQNTLKQKTFKRTEDLPNYERYLARAEEFTKDRIRFLLQSESRKQAAA